MMNPITNNKLHGQDALLQAIDFFSQKFNMSQLSNYAFEFTNQMLSLNSSALFVQTKDGFQLVKVKNYDVAQYLIEDTSKLQRIATFYGNVMTAGFHHFFEEKDLEVFTPQLVIPLIVKDLLYGFIITKGKVDVAISQDDLTMSKALMQLINNSLESCKNLIDLQHINHELDQKIFNLFSINHSSRMLLSELDLHKLYSLAIDIFSELTSSRITAFGLYDEIKDRIVIRGYKDVFSSTKLQMDFELLDSAYDGYKIVFHYQEDKELLQGIFKNYQDFKCLDSEYIILIVRERVLGFVTISKPVNDRAYDQGVFELIESLAASTYISFKNAIYFNEINRQRSSIQQKLNTLTNLNILIRNINSCATIGELCDISIKTLHYSFGIRKAFIVLKEKDSFVIKNHVGFELHNNKLEMNARWENIHQNSVVSYMSYNAADYFSKSLLEDVGASNCLVIHPISISNTDLEKDQEPLGYIVVLETTDALKEEEALLIETMSNSISPIVSHLQELKKIKDDYVVNQRKAFMKSLDAKLRNRSKYLIEFYIYYKKIIQIPFEQLDLSCYNQYEYYYFDNMLIVISYDKLHEAQFDGSIEASCAEDTEAKLTKAYIQNL
ncbi:MAG: hypothetical protein K0Q65_712 [Clostridia bacterium]|nr:hypothetical protein [Clostridia bacterium]